MEKTKEHQVLLHLNVVDFKAAFDTIWRGIVEVGDVYWIDSKIISLIEIMYDNVECAVVISGQLTEWLEIGVREGYLL